MGLSASGESQGKEGGGTSAAEGAAAGVEGCAGGHHVVEKHKSGGRLPQDAEGAAHILLAGSSAEVGLGLRVPGPPEAVPQAGDSGMSPPEVAEDFLSLVEPPFSPSARMEGDCHERGIGGEFGVVGG